MRKRAFILAAIAASAGCVAGFAKTHSFPPIWPSAIDYAVSDAVRPEQTGPMILVNTLNYGTGEQGSGPATAMVLTEALVQRLQQKGIAARTSAGTPIPDAERLDCTVDKLQYTTLPKYPKTVQYEAEMACSLTPPQTAQPRWQQRLAQRYDKVTVLNTMTKLPVQYEATLYRECIIPLWDAMAISLKTYLDHAPTPAAPAAAPEPAPPREPAVERPFSK